MNETPSNPLNGNELPTDTRKPSSHPAPIDVNPELPRTIDDAEVDEAAKELGLTTFSAKQARNLVKIGAFQEKLGVVHQSVGKVVFADSALQRLLNVSVELAENVDEDAMTRVQAVVSGKQVASELLHSAELLVQLQTDGLVNKGSGGRQRRFVDDAPVVTTAAVQVNVTGAEKVEVLDSSTKKKDDVT